MRKSYFVRGKWWFAVYKRFDGGGKGFLRCKSLSTAVFRCLDKCATASTVGIPLLQRSQEGEAPVGRDVQSEHRVVTPVERDVQSGERVLTSVGRVLTEKMERSPRHKAMCKVNIG